MVFKISTRILSFDHHFFGEKATANTDHTNPSVAWLHGHEKDKKFVSEHTHGKIPKFCCSFVWTSSIKAVRNRPGSYQSTDGHVFSRLINFLRHGPVLSFRRKSWKSGLVTTPPFTFQTRHSFAKVPNWLPGKLFKRLEDRKLLNSNARLINPWRNDWPVSYPGTNPEKDHQHFTLPFEDRKFMMCNFAGLGRVKSFWLGHQNRLFHLFKPLQSAFLAQRSKESGMATLAWTKLPVWIASGRLWGDSRVNSASNPAKSISTARFPTV